MEYPIGSKVIAHCKAERYNDRQGIIVSINKEVFPNRTHIEYGLNFSARKFNRQGAEAWFLPTEISPVEQKFGLHISLGGR